MNEYYSINLSKGKTFFTDIVIQKSIQNDFILKFFFHLF